jgi:catechol 2,3-dioxygenase-like lactoylglutathione lyase family enzyme
LALLVHDYDEAIKFFTGALGFVLVEDTVMSLEKRWVVVSPGDRGAQLILAKAANDDQRAAVGNQAGGRVFLFLRTDDFTRDYERMREHGVRFAEEPREEAFGRVVVFFDLYGNKWDLVQAT